MNPRIVSLLKRFGAVAALSVSPWLFFREQQLSPIDLPTARKVYAALDAEIERERGPMIPERFERESAATFGKGGALLHIFWLAALEREKSGEAEFNDPVVDSIASEHGEDLDRWDRLTRAGLWREPNAKFFDRLEAGTIHHGPPLVHTVNPWAIERLSKMETALAASAARRGDWAAALKRLSQAAHAMDCFWPSGAASRIAVYEAFQSLLAFDPPAEFERAALAELLDLAKTDPLPDNLAARQFALREWDQAFEDAKKGYRSGADGRMSWAIDETAVMAAKRPALLSNSRLALWAARYSGSRDFRAIKKLGSPDRFVNAAKHGGVRWTTIPASAKWFLRAMSEEPALSEGSLPSANSRAGLDPWTWAILNSPGWLLAPEPWRWREERELLARGDAIRAAYAARVWRRERGDWPASLVDLASAYLPGFAEPKKRFVAAAPAAPLGALRIGWIATNDEIRRDLWTRLLPSALFHQAPFSSGGEIDQVFAHSSLPLGLGLAAVQAMRHHPALVESADLWIPPAEDAPEGEWIRVDEALVQKFVEQRDKAWRGPRNNEPEPKPIATRWRVTAKLRAPERLLAIWAPGLDGIDHGGALPLDRSKGGMTGDFVAFPEGF